MNILIALLAIYGFAFIIKQADGPWGLIARWRNWIMRLPFIGVQFFNLLDCWGCLGFWAGLVVYLLSNEIYKLNQALLWGLSGMSACLIINAVLTRLWRQ